MKFPSEQEKLEIYKEYDAFIFDLDGTLWRGNQVIDGAIQLVDLLTSNSKKVFFVTNNATKSRQGNVKKLTSMGISSSLDQVYNSAHAAASYLKGIGFKRKVYVIGEEGLVEELQSAGFTVVGGPEHRGQALDWSAQGEPAVDVDPEVGAVVVGLDRHISYYKLQYAVTCLLENDGCVFVACNTDARGNLTSAREWCGAGTMVAAVRGASERQPVVVGKPSPCILDQLCAAHGLKKERCLVVGDRLDTDIEWGIQNGAGTLLVLTGVTSQTQLLSPSNLTHPRYYLTSIKDMLTVKDQLSSSCSIQ